MERDLAVQAGTMLSDVTGDKLDVSERQSLEVWLSDQLDTERRGWKQKLQMALKEADKERKMALEVHGAVHRINEKIETKTPNVTLLREKSQYHGSEKDQKVSHVDTLDKNVDAILSLLLRLQSANERLDSELSARGSNESAEQDPDKDVSPLQTELAESRDTEQRLTREIDVMTDTIRLQESLLDEEKQKHLSQVNELKHIISAQRRAEVNNAESSTVPLARESIVSTVPLVRELDTQDKSVQVSLRLPYRECCIQTDVTPDADVMTYTADVTARSCDGRETLKPVTAVAIHSTSSPLELQLSSISADAVSGRHLSRSDLEILQRTNMKRHVEGHFKAAGRHNGHKLTVEGLSHNGHKQTIEDMGHNGHKHTIEGLRTQVVGFAEKLDNARRQMSEYEQQMSLFKTTPANKRPVGGAYTVYPSPGGSHRSWHTSGGGGYQGYLGGIRVSDKNEFLREKNSPRADKTNPSLPRNGNGIYGNGGGLHTCLRCHKAYRSKENHKAACHYHTKSRQRIERYDSGDKLMRIIQVWECCLERDDAIGCAVGEHI